MPTVFPDAINTKLWIENFLLASQYHPKYYAQQLKQSDIANSAIRNPQSAINSRWVYQELRDRKIALFLDTLPEGVWQIRYEMRAETPGNFHALPVLGHAMYVPEIRCNGEEMKVVVVDQP